MDSTSVKFDRGEKKMTTRGYRYMWIEKRIVLFVFCLRRKQGELQISAENGNDDIRRGGKTDGKRYQGRLERWVYSTANHLSHRKRETNRTTLKLQWLTSCSDGQDNGRTVQDPSRMAKHFLSFLWR